MFSPPNPPHLCQLAFIQGGATVLPLVTLFAAMGAAQTTHLELQKWIQGVMQTEVAQYWTAANVFGFFSLPNWNSGMKISDLEPGPYPYKLFQEKTNERCKFKISHSFQITYSPPTRVQVLPTSILSFSLSAAYIRAPSFTRVLAQASWQSNTCWG